jgi:hypothetical protein
MTLPIWMILLFVAGLAALLLCGLFLKACEHI